MNIYLNIFSFFVYANGFIDIIAIKNNHDGKLFVYRSARMITTRTYFSENTETKIVALLATYNFVISLLVRG